MVSNSGVSALNAPRTAIMDRFLLSHEINSRKLNEVLLTLPSKINYIIRKGKKTHNSPIREIQRSDKYLSPVMNDAFLLWEESINK